jgi:hypothetical protein
MNKFDIGLLRLEPRKEIMMRCVSVSPQFRLGTIDEGNMENLNAVFRSWSPEVGKGESLTLSEHEMLGLWLAVVETDEAEENECFSGHRHGTFRIR